jgi:hypothetical protein
LQAGELWGCLGIQPAHPDQAAQQAETENNLGTLRFHGFCAVRLRLMELAKP